MEIHKLPEELLFFKNDDINDKVFIEEVTNILNNKILQENTLGNLSKFFKFSFKTYAYILVAYYGFKYGLTIYNAGLKGITEVFKTADGFIRDIPSITISATSRTQAVNIILKLVREYNGSKLNQFLIMTKDLDKHLDKKLTNVYSDIQKMAKKNPTDDNIRLILAGLESIKRNMISEAQRNITVKIFGKFKFKDLRENSKQISTLVKNVRNKNNPDSIKKMKELISESLDIIKDNDEFLKTIENDIMELYDVLDNFEEKYRDKILGRSGLEGGALYHLFEKGLNIIKIEIKKNMRLVQKTAQTYNNVSKDVFRRINKLSSFLSKGE